LSTDYISQAQALLRTDIAGLEHLHSHIDAAFESAVHLMARQVTDGHKILVTGVGKSYDIGQKIASTLNSTGTPAFALHASEALHGGLGMIQDGDVVLAISYTGETHELITMLPFASRSGAHIVSICGRAESSLAKLSDERLLVAVEQEACPFNLAPTTSSLVTLAIGDVVAMLLSQNRGFSREDYARLHPSGAIGHSLLKVTDVMRTGDRIAKVHRQDKAKDAVIAITKTKSGAVAVVDDADIVVGIVTDGDIRRLLLTTDNISGYTVDQMMTENPISFEEDHLAVEAMGVFEKHNINSLIITTSSGVLAGMIDLQDMPKVKLL
jgi:arabinose-5-phosphate isomerase